MIFLKHAKGYAKDVIPQLPEMFRQAVNKAAGYSAESDNPTPYYRPSVKEQLQSALNLAGTAQTGAFPFAPKGAGTLGSIRKPGEQAYLGSLVDLWTTEGLNANVEGVDLGTRILNSNLKNTYTDNDSLVKSIDRTGEWPFTNVEEGFFPSLNFGEHVKDALIEKITAETGKRPPASIIHALNQYVKSYEDEVIRAPQGDYRIHTRTFGNPDLRAQLAQYVRDIRGTKQVAETPAGKAYEDYQDLSGFIHMKAPDAKGHKTLGRLLEDEYDYFEGDFEGMPALEQLAAKEKQKVENLRNNIAQGKIPLEKRLFPVYATDDAPDAYDEMADSVNALVNQGRINPRSLASGQIPIDRLYDYLVEHRTNERNKELNLNEETASREYTVAKVNDDGTEWHKLTTPDSLKYESSKMHNCVKQYANDVNTGKLEVYSLRDQNRKPSLTLGLKPAQDGSKELTQVYGPNNRAPTKEEIAQIGNFLLHKPEKIGISKMGNHEISQQLTDYFASINKFPF